MSELNIRIEKFIRENLYPKEEERKDISIKYEKIKKLLPESEYTIFQSGSYARTTATTPLNDLDIICDSDNPHSSIDVIFGILDKEYKGEAEIIKQDHSIGIHFIGEKGFKIDLVPAKKRTDLKKNEYGEYLYELPDFLKTSLRNRTKEMYNSKNILLSDPKGYIAMALMVDKNSIGVFKKAVKFCKKWNYGVKSLEKSDTFKTFKSFHIEEIIKSYFISIPGVGLYEVLLKFFTEAGMYLERPSFKDRADPKIYISPLSDSLYIDQYVADLSLEQKSTIKGHLLKALNLLKILPSKDDYEEIENTLNLLLGITKIQPPRNTINVPHKSSPHFYLGK